VETAIPGQPEVLTPREVEILGLLAEGCSNADISKRLVISPNTVKRHIAHLFEKLAVTSRTQALVRARSLGIV
jgi:ATP/maltotriose-dependent transcriptional regulator MalT